MKWFCTGTSPNISFVFTVMLAATGIAQSAPNSSPPPLKPRSATVRPAPPPPASQQVQRPSPPPQARPVPQQTQRQPSPRQPQAAPGGSTALQRSPASGQTSGNARQLSATLSPRPLSANEATQKVQAIQVFRSHLAGINHAALPAGRWSENPDHTLALAGTNGHNYLLRPSGTVRSYKSPGKSALLDSSGNIQALRAQNLIVNRGALGVHGIFAKQQGAVVVSYGSHRGYVERQVKDGGRSLLQRVQVTNGHVSEHLYRSLTYGNSAMVAYVPEVSYGPAFSAWLGAKWSAPAVYSWSWATGSTAAYYGSYYAPATSYTSPNQWMTDYILTSNLQEGYTAQADSGAQAINGQAGLAMGEDMPIAAAATPAPISQEVRAQVSAQIARDAAALNKNAASSAAGATHGTAVHQTPELPAALDPTIHIFLVANTMSVLSGSRQCQLRQGDILFLPQPAVAGSASAELSVESSQKGDCPGDARVVVTIEDLQEMSNHFREGICSAEQTLATHDRAPSLPQAPQADPVLTVAGAKISPQDEAAALASVEQLQSRADQEEKDVKQEMGTPPSSHN